MASIEITPTTLLIGAAAAVGLYLALRPTPAAAAPPQPQILPGPNNLPSLPTNPTNPTNPTQADLLSKATALILQATSDPATVDPAQLDNLATQLEANGLTQQAAGLRTLSAQIKAQRALPNLPPAQTNATPPGGAGAPLAPGTPLPADIPGYVAVFVTNPTVTPTQVDQLIARIQAGFPGQYLVEITKLQQYKTMLVARGPVQTIAGVGAWHPWMHRHVRTHQPYPRYFRR